MENKNVNDFGLARSEKNEKKNTIVCDVKNCTYHCGECECKADFIAVGPTYANCSNDTVCATFKPKSQ